MRASSLCASHSTRSNGAIIGRPRAVAGAGLGHCFLTASQLARPRGRLGEHAIDVAGERLIAALLDIEWPFAAELDPAFTQLGQKPAEHGHAGPARSLEFAPFAEDPFAQPVFESSPCPRLEQPLQGTDSSATPGIELEWRGPLVGLHTRVR